MQFQAVLGQGQMEFSSENVYQGDAMDVGSGLAFQSYPNHAPGDPPPLPHHLRVNAEEASRSGMFAGLARAGHALRRRVIDPVVQHVSRGSPAQAPFPHPEAAAAQVSSDPHREGLLQPAVAEAMQELTNRRSLITPGPCAGTATRDEGSTGSLSSELVREEVRRHVQLAMASKDNELKDLRQQNESLRRALQSSSLNLREEGVGHERGCPGGDRFERSGLEPVLSSASRVPEPHVPQGDPLQVYSRAQEPSGNLPCAGVPQSVPAGGLGRPLDHGGQSGGSLRAEVAPGPAHMSSVDSGTVREEPLHLLVQGMRQLQQAYIGKSDAKDSELKGTVEVPPMPDTGPEASVAFADWLYEVEQAIGSLSDKASTWFAACLEVAQRAYAEYSLASPLNRLAMKPVIPDTLRDEKWARLERRVMTLLLGAMRRPAKEDAITHRILDVPSLLFRLHVLYQPGGVSERAAVLKHLAGRPVGEDVHECIAALRKWRRYLERAEAMHVAIPDSSILLRALETMIKKVLQAFRRSSSGWTLPRMSSSFKVGRLWKQYSVFTPTS